MSLSTSVRALAPIAKRAGQIFKAKSPTILIAVGVVSGVASTVTAIIRTPKCQQVREEFEAAAKKADECLSVGEVTIEEKGETKTIKYTDDIYKKDMLSLHFRKYLGYARVYAPTVALCGISVASILLSHGIMRRRNSALTAAVASVSEAFRRYRENVKREYGDKADYNMRHSIISEKTKVTEIDPETGKHKTVTKTVNKRRDDAPWYSDYARLYQEGCRGWTKNPSSNVLSLTSFEANANQKLRTQGYLFLNEVYDMLGIERTQAGHVMGWIYTKEENEFGDNFVSFGFQNAWDFVSLQENTVWLDFNVDDIPIVDRIKWGIK